MSFTGLAGHLLGGGESVGVSGKYPSVGSAANKLVNECHDGIQNQNHVALPIL